MRAFNASSVVAWTQAYDPHRLVDTDSGGPANDLHVGDVNDIHSYPYPGNPVPSETQVAMVGEFGGIGTYDNTNGNNEWARGQCHTYLHEPTAAAYANTYVAMISTITANKVSTGLSYCVYTQTTDVENECDGMVNMDRTPKFTPDQIAQIRAANLNLTQN